MHRPRSAFPTIAAIMGLTLGLSQGPLLALDLAFPGTAEETASRSDAQGSFRMPVGAFAAGELPTQLVEGALEQVAFRVAVPQPSTLALVKALRDQVIAAGYEVLFECETALCGGYDFRYGADVLPEPDMHVDLGDFRYLAAQRQSGGAAEFLALLVSRSRQDGYVQITRVNATGQIAPLTPPVVQRVTPDAPKNAEKPEKPFEVAAIQTEPTGFTAQLASGKVQVLEDLVFASGSSALTKGNYPSLSTLAEWLKADDRRKVTFVGHTDASGSLEGNLRLSQLRAESVRQHVLSFYKVAPDQIDAQGVGYLSPRETNLTEEGRRANRRVEVFSTATQLPKP